MGARLLNVRERQVLASIRWGSRVAPWNHITLNELHRLGLAESKLNERRNGGLATTKTWYVTDAGRKAYDSPKEPIALRGGGL